jgi:chromatin remodeling complex protein RSC6
LATKRKSKKRSKSQKSKSKSKSKGKKKPFGGYAISFSGREETMEDVFGKGKVTPSEMTKKIWKFIKAKRLASK